MLQPCLSSPISSNSPVHLFARYSENETLNRNFLKLSSADKNLAVSNVPSNMEPYSGRCHDGQHYGWPGRNSDVYCHRKIFHENPSDFTFLHRVKTKLRFTAELYGFSRLLSLHKSTKRKEPRSTFRCIFLKFKKKFIAIYLIASIVTIVKS